MKIIGITGGIASGKSTVMKHIDKIANEISQDISTCIINCDEIADDLSKCNGDYLNTLHNIFGQSIFDDDDVLLKHKLAEIVFNDSNMLQLLNETTHPFIIQEIKLSIEHFMMFKSNSKGIIFIEAPLLFQSNLHKEIKFDEIWIVEIDTQMQLDRLLERNPEYTVDYAVTRINAQTIKYNPKDTIFIKVIDNTGTEIQLINYINSELSKLGYKVNPPNNNIAVYMGSFDPPTNGHLQMIKQASNLFSKVYVVIGMNANKKCRYNHIPRANMLNKILEENNITNCEVCITDKLAVKFCEKVGASYLFRGLRNTTDFAYEENIAKINSKLNPNIITIYGRAEDEAISSSMVKELFDYGEDISSYIPEATLEAMMHDYNLEDNDE